MKQTDNLLVKFLKKNNIKQVELARTMSALRGGTVYPHQICSWCKGHTKPHSGTAYFIELATKGAVRRTDWKSPRKTAK